MAHGVAMSAHPARIHSAHDVVVCVPALLGYWPGSSLCLVLLDSHGTVDVLARWDAPGDPTDDVALREAAASAESGYLVVTDPTTERPPGDWIDVLPAGITSRVRLRDIVVMTCFGDDLEWRSAADPTPRRCAREEAWAAARRRGLPSWESSRDEYIGDIRPRPKMQRLVAERIAAATAVTEATRDVAILQTVEWVTSDGPVEIAAVADLIVALGDIPVRDTVLWDILRSDPREWTGMADRLAQAVAAAPDVAAAPVASLLAVLRWQSGDGTRAWAALERALTVAPSYSLAYLVGSCLAAGMHPSTWREGMASLTREECRRQAVTTPG